MIETFPVARAQVVRSDIGAGIVYVPQGVQCVSYAGTPPIGPTPTPTPILTPNPVCGRAGVVWSSGYYTYLDLLHSGFPQNIRTDPAIGNNIVGKLAKGSTTPFYWTVTVGGQVWLGISLDCNRWIVALNAPLYDH